MSNKLLNTKLTKYNRHNKVGISLEYKLITFLKSKPLMLVYLSGNGKGKYINTDLWKINSFLFLQMDLNHISIIIWLKKESII